MKSKIEIIMNSKVKRALLFNIFILFIACAHMFFYIKNTIITGGFTSLALIIYHMLGMEEYNQGYIVGLIALVLNIPLMIYSWKYFGRQYVFKSIYGTLSLSIFIMAISKFVCFFNIIISPMPLWLASFVGSILDGIGMGGLNALNGSAGGSDIIGKIIHRHFPRISIGRGISISGITIILISSLIFSLEHTTYSVLTIFFAGIVTDLVIFNLVARKR